MSEPEVRERNFENDAEVACETDMSDLNGSVGVRLKCIADVLLIHHEFMHTKPVITRRYPICHPSYLESQLSGRTLLGRLLFWSMDACASLGEFSLNLKLTCIVSSTENVLAGRYMMTTELSRYAANIPRQPPVLYSTQRTSTTTWNHHCS